MSSVTIISSDKNWLEHTAVSQLNNIASLPGVVNTVGLPDLHPGKTPVGAAIITDGIIYPHLVGNDIGCGMALFMTELDKRKLKYQRLAKKAESCESLKEIRLPGTFEDVSHSPLGTSLGTF